MKSEDLQDIAQRVWHLCSSNGTFVFSIACDASLRRPGKFHPLKPNRSVRKQSELAQSQVICEW